MKPPELPKLLWIDIETGGLCPKTHPLFEVGMVLTDSDLTPMVSFHCLVKDNIPDHLMTYFCEDMHGKNGLLAQLREQDIRLSPTEMEEAMCAHLETWKAMFNDGHQLIPAGLNVNFDLSFLFERAPEIQKHLSYRTFDLSTLRHFYGTPPYEVIKHRSISDVHAEIRAAKHYLNLRNQSWITRLWNAIRRR